MDSGPSPRRGIGGYFELEVGRPGAGPFPQALTFQSARAAFLTLLMTGRPRRAWLPWYLCDAMTEPVRAAGVELLRYGLEEDFSVGADVELRDGDWLLCVNYFGLCDAAVAAALRRFPADQVVLDNSHALLAPPGECLATLYSPRKFVGVPDGGYLVTRMPVPAPDTEDTFSLQRALPLLARLAGEPEDGHAAWLANEAALSGQAPRRMSNLTHTLLACIDYGGVAARRIANYEWLAGSLGASNPFKLPRGKRAVPLCYPYAAPAGLRERLIANRVFVPQYWPEVAMGAAALPAFERYLATACVPLPCDQRYGQPDMEFVAALVRQESPPAAIVPRDTLDAGES